MSLADRFHPTKYDERYIHFALCVSSMDTVAAALDELYNKGYSPGNKIGRVKNETEAEHLLEILNTPGALTCVLNVKGLEAQWPRFEYIKSNLTGYIYYFLCSDCGKRVKFLYHTNSSYGYKCRDCQRLRYPPNKKYLYNL